MGKCKYPSWAINKVQNIVLNSNQGEHDNNQPSTTNTKVQPDNNQGASSTNRTTTTSTKNFIGQILIPYTQGTAEGFKKIVVSMVSKYISREKQLSSSC